MNEWWWWLVIWGVPLVLGGVLLATSKDGLSGLGAILFFGGVALFIIGLPFAAIWDVATPCDGYGIEHADNGFGTTTYCVTDNGTRFQP